MTEYQFPDVKPFVTLNHTAPIFHITLVNGENRFSVECIKAWHTCLDTIERIRSAETGPAALITSSAHPKIFSNGLVLEEAFAIGPPYFAEYQKLLARVLTFPMPTVAIMNGHAYAEMLAFAHDYRVMRSDVGFMCMNEVDIPLPVTPGMATIIRTKIPNPLEYRKILLEGHRFSGIESMKLGMVDALGKDEKEVMEEGRKIAMKFSHKVANPKVGGAVYQYLKKEMYDGLYKLLLNDQLGYVPEFVKMSKAGMKAKM